MDFKDFNWIYFSFSDTSTSAGERNSLEDVLFNDEDNLLESDFDDDKFFVALRLSPKPEQLVKGYEFQMLNKWVILKLFLASFMLQEFNNLHEFEIFQICWYVHFEQSQPDQQTFEHNISSFQTDGSFRHLQLSKFYNQDGNDILASLSWLRNNYLIQYHKLDITGSKMAVNVSLVLIMCTVLTHGTQ